MSEDKKIETTEVEETAVEAEKVTVEETAVEETAVEETAVEETQAEEVEETEVEAETEVIDEDATEEAEENEEEKEAPAVVKPAKKYNKKGIIAIIAFVLMLALIFTCAVANTNSVDPEEYFAEFEIASSNIVQDAYGAAIIVNSRMSYYSENATIDFMYAEDLEALQIYYIEDQESMESLSNPPKQYKELYLALCDVFEAYEVCYDLAYNYGTDEEAYYASGDAAILDFIDVYTVFYELLVAEYDDVA